MKNKYLVLISGLASLLFCLCLAQVSFADDNNPADFLVEIGERHLKKGDVASAVHEFSKALMLDQDNQKAKGYLNELGIRQGLYSGIETTQTQVAKMAGHIRDYRIKIFDLQTEKYKMEKKFAELKSEKQSLSEVNLARDTEIIKLVNKLGSVEKLIRQKEESLQAQKNQEKKMIFEFENIVSRKNEFLRETLLRKENQLNAMKFALNEKEQNLKDLKERLADVVNSSVDDSNELASLSKRHWQFKKNAFVINGRQDRMIHVLEDILHFNENRLDDAKDKVVIKEINLVDNQEILLSQMDDLVEMSDSIIKYQERLDGRDDLIDRKNVEITDLKSQITNQ